MSWQRVGNISGKDADLGVIEEMRAAITALRAEIAATKALGLNGDVAAMVAQLVNEHVKKCPMPRDGKDVDESALHVFVEEAVNRAVAAIPPAKNGEPGQSVTVSDVAPLVAAEVEKAVLKIRPKDGEPGRPGKDADPSLIAKLIAAAVSTAVDALPPAQDGRSLTVEDVAPLIANEVEKSVKALPLAKDGIGVLGALIDRDGQLVVTLSDGTVKTLGQVVGRDVDMGDVQKQIGDVLAQWPRPHDGKDGTDGFGFDDIDVVVTDEGCYLAFAKGENVKQFRLPIVFDKGVYKADTVYQKGDGVTWGGSFWISQQVTNAKPGGPEIESRAWRLAVKAGRDGRTGAQGKAGPIGPRGPQGERW